MNLKTLLLSALSLVFFSSCTQLKNLTAHDNTASTSPQKQKNNKALRFIDNISVTPGQATRTKHTTMGPSVPKSISVNDKEYKPERAANYPAGDMERGDWLQVKYALILDASPESLTNINLLKSIDEWWGTRYAMGGSTKEGIDCSAFTQIILSNVYGVSIPRNSGDQYKASQTIEDDQLQEGDLVFFTSGSRTITHVGIYIANNKFVHASTSQGVMVSDLNESYWKNKYKGAGRVRSN